MQETNQYTVNFKCHACGKVHPFTIHALIDSAKDINAEQKVLTGEYFETVCPYCHQVQPIMYTCAYHDGAKRLLILLADDEKAYAEIEALLNNKNDHSKLYEAIEGWLDGSTVRLVRNVYELQEKVLIAHYGYDDRIIEIARKILTNQLSDTMQNIIHLYFNVDENGEGQFMIETERGMEESVPFSEKAYAEYKEKYASILLKKEYEINEQWAEKVIPTNEKKSV